VIKETLGNWMPRIRTATILALFFMQGCVTSQFPLLDKNALVADNSLAGHYVLRDASDKQQEFNLYVKGKMYLIARDSELAYIATIHTWQGDTFIAQLRMPAETTNAKSTPSPFFYMLVTKTDNGLNLNLIGCESGGDCSISTIDELSKLAAAAQQHPQDSQLATATKTTELNQ
jgi:hypothetical protein